MIFFFTIAVILSFLAGFLLATFDNKKNEQIIVENFQDIAELIEELKELGFEQFDSMINLEAEPTINDLKKAIQESEFSSNDEK